MDNRMDRAREKGPGAPAYQLEAGIRGRAERLVEEGLTAAAMGSGTLAVLATPAMVALMEQTALESVAPYLEPGCTSVGTALNIAHSAATALGERVYCESELTAVDGRRLTFQVRAFDAAGEIGRGTHERFVVDAQRFLNKVGKRGEKRE